MEFDKSSGRMKTNRDTNQLKVAYPPKKCRTLKENELKEKNTVQSLIKSLRYLKHIHHIIF